jgi:hypothetical protein
MLHRLNHVVRGGHDAVDAEARVAVVALFSAKNTQTPLVCSFLTHGRVRLRSPLKPLSTSGVGYLYAPSISMRPTGTMPEATSSGDPALIAALGRLLSRTFPLARDAG